MPVPLIIFLTFVGVVISTVFGTVTYSLRDFSRPRVNDLLTKRGMAQWFEPTVAHSSELAFLTATFRLLSNLLIYICFVALCRHRGWAEWSEYTVAAVASAVLSILFAVTIPHVLAQHVGDQAIALFARQLNGLRVISRPLTKLLQLTENVVSRARPATPQSEEQASEDIESDILAAVQEGEKEGVVEETEREMIESVIEFARDTTADVMTPRSEVEGLPVDAKLESILGNIEETGHSRIPIYEGSLDHIVGILYARDLLKYVGESTDRFDMRKAVRPPLFVPETKPLRELLQDFRLQKVHMAIVLDEYGGTAGLVTIEDVIEELVGEISDEHEPIEPAVFRRLDELSAEVDAKIEIDELNRLLGTKLPEDEEFGTLGGFLGTRLGRIPKAGTKYEEDGATYTVISAEPQKINRVKVELAPPPADEI